MQPGRVRIASPISSSSNFTTNIIDDYKWQLSCHIRGERIVNNFVIDFPSFHDDAVPLMQLYTSRISWIHWSPSRPLALLSTAWTVRGKHCRLNLNHTLSGLFFPILCKCLGTIREDARRITRWPETHRSTSIIWPVWFITIQFLISFQPDLCCFPRSKSRIRRH